VIVIANVILIVILILLLPLVLNTYQLEATAAASIEITTEGLIKLINSLTNGKSPVPDGIRKPDLLVDVSCVPKTDISSIN